MEKLKIELSVDEINIILFSLSKQPYESVYGIIANIQNQAQIQLNVLPPKEEITTPQ